MDSLLHSESPFKTIISFHKLIESFEEIALSNVDYRSNYAKAILKEVETIHALLPKDQRDFWVSFTLQDELKLEQPLLRSGENIQQAAEMIIRLGAKAVLFNCCQPEVILKAIIAIKSLLPEGIEIGAYANAFPPQNNEATANDGLDEVRTDLNPALYLKFAQEWKEAGATLIGGCCGIDPEHISELSKFFK